MKPVFVPGDLVTVVAGAADEHVGGLVISVQQANRIPDVHERGLTDCQPWSFWLITSGKQPKFAGPFRAWELRAAYA